MNKTEAKNRINKLKSEIEHHRYLYHVLDKQEISDAALDSLKHELTELESQFPDLLAPDSPSQRVSGAPLDKFKKIPHQVRMLSLNDSFSIEEMQDWETRIKKLVPGEKLEYYAELKIDGLAMSLIYEDGVLKNALTRGDGREGEDVTENIKTIESIPLKLRDEHKGRIEVRGEVYMDKKIFDKINRQQKKKGEPEYANPRNTAAGSIRQLDPKIAASRKLDYLAYQLITDLGESTHKEKHEILKKLGFKTDKFARVCKNLDEVQKFFKEVENKRDKLDYWIDGIVVQVNSNKTFTKLGTVGKTHRGAIAYKFPAEQAATIVEDIQVQVGRTGALTPVAHLKPVQVAGSTVSRATLHNEDEIKRLGIKIGDTIILEKAGDIIPDVVEVLLKLRPKTAKSFHFPATCPDCGSKVERKKGEAAHYCTNPNCFTQEKERIYHFVSKKGFDIDGLGPRIIDQLIDEGLISDASGLFDLEPGDTEPLEGFAEKAAQNLIESIDKAKNISLARFIYSLGIRNVGEETAIDLAQYFGSLKKLMSASLEELDSMHEIGEVSAQSIFNYFNDDKNKKLISDLLAKGVTLENPKQVSQKFKDQSFIFTGSLEELTRDQAKEKIRTLGGKIVSSVSPKTDYLIAGEKAGSKLEKAKKLGVKILSEQEFLKLIG